MRGRVLGIFIFIWLSYTLLWAYFLYKSPNSSNGMIPFFFKYWNQVSKEVSNGVTFSFHTEGYEDAWIGPVEDGEVWVETVDEKISISFRPMESDLHIFSEHKGWLIGVTFECGKAPDEVCDLEQPYKLYVGNVEVELVFIEEKQL